MGAIRVPHISVAEKGTKQRALLDDGMVVFHFSHADRPEPPLSIRAGDILVNVTYTDLQKYKFPRDSLPKTQLGRHRSICDSSCSFSLIPYTSPSL